MNSIKSLLVYLLLSLVNIGLVMADYLPAQPGDPGTSGMSVPIDGGILMGLLTGLSLITMFFKKKKKD